MVLLKNSKEQRRGYKGAWKLTHWWRKHENDELYEKANKVDKFDNAAAVIKNYEEIIRSKKRTQ